VPPIDRPPHPCAPLTPLPLQVRAVHGLGAREGRRGRCSRSCAARARGGGGARGGHQRSQGRAKGGAAGARRAAAPAAAAGAPSPRLRTRAPEPAPRRPRCCYCCHCGRRVCYHSTQAAAAGGLREPARARGLWSDGTRHPAAGSGDPRIAARSPSSELGAWAAAAAARVAAAGAPRPVRATAPRRMAGRGASSRSLRRSACA